MKTERTFSECVSRKPAGKPALRGTLPHHHTLIQNAGTDPSVRVFLQTPRHGEKKPWALWLFEHKYAVNVAERNDYCLLKTAFMIRSKKQEEFEYDWQASQKGQND